LSRSLGEARRVFEKGERAAGPIRERLLRTIAAEPLAKIDYAQVVDPNTLEPVERIEAEALIALAVYVGKTRLIDNTILGSARDKK
jgi:pantoate--beta-alanine ligase